MSSLAIVATGYYAREARRKNAASQGRDDGGAWKNTLFVRITNSEDFRAAVSSAIALATRPLTSLEPRDVAELGSSLNDLLLAVSADDFERFWKFRAPNGVCFFTAASVDSQKSFIEHQQEAHNVVIMDVESLRRTQDPKTIMEAAWKLMRYPATRMNISVKVCTDCIGEVSLEQLAVHLIPLSRGGEFRSDMLGPKLLEAIRQYPNRGAFIHTGGFQSFQNIKSEDFVVAAILPLKMKSGYTAAAHVFFKRSIGAPLTPVALGIADTTFRAPRLPF